MESQIQQAIREALESLVASVREPNYEAVALMAQAAGRRAKAIGLLEGHDRLITAGVPTATAEALVADKFDRAAPLLRKVEAMVKASRLSVVAGPPGVGKSVAAAWALLRLRRSAVWYPAFCAANTDFATWDTEQFGRLCTATMLVVDDLGFELRDRARGEIAAGRLASVLMARADSSHLRTLVLSNCDHDRFSEVYDGGQGGPLASRIGQAWVVASGADRRLNPVDIASGRRRISRARAFVELCDRVEAATYVTASQEPLSPEDRAAMMAELSIGDAELAEAVAAAKVSYRETIDGLGRRDND